jgi:hypothetical protein
MAKVMLAIAGREGIDKSAEQVPEALRGSGAVLRIRCLSFENTNSIGLKSGL